MARRFPVRSVLLVALLAIAAVGPATAAGSTPVVLDPSQRTVSTGETVTFAVVVTSADRGVGSVDLGVTVGNSDVARMTDIDPAGSAEFVSRNVSSNGTEATLTTAGMNTPDAGRVTVATVTLDANATGETALNLSVAAVGDEEGVAYDVTAVRDAALTVSADAGGDTGGEAGSVAAEPSETARRSTDAETATPASRTTPAPSATAAEPRTATAADAGSTTPAAATDRPRQQSSSTPLVAGLATATLLALATAAYLRHTR